MNKGYDIVVGMVSIQILSTIHRPRDVDLHSRRLIFKTRMIKPDTEMES